MSLRAIYRTLETFAQTRAADLALTARATALASASKWSKKAEAQFNKLLSELDAIANPDGTSMPKQISRRELQALFAGLGVQREAEPSRAS